MAKKTNKTAHVLNLLTKSPAVQEEGTAEENKAPAEHQAAAPVSAPATVTVVDESGNEQLEKNILEQLENEVSQAASEEAKPASVPKAKISAAKEEAPVGKREVPVSEPEIPKAQTEVPAVKEGASVTEPPVAQPEAPVVKTEASVPENTEMSVETAQEIPTAMAEEKAADAEAKVKETAQEKTPVKESSFVNVMEELLKRQDIDRYMEQYKVCRCERCRADVEALTLTRLPAKYVAAKSGFGTSGMNYYENKYKIRILTEIIRSCVAVREHPRHD
ncbi:late competence development ComFB family protein [Lachnospiraceae bacterium 46-15]